MDKSKKDVGHEIKKVVGVLDMRLNKMQIQPKHETGVDNAKSTFSKE